MAASDACCPEVPAPAADMSGLLGACAAPSAAGGGGGGGSASVLAQAYAFQKLCAHLQLRTDVQNVDVMNLSGFCRNCLSKWYAAGMAAQSSPIEYDAATQVVYGGWWPTLLHFAAAVPCACPRPHPHPVTHLSLSYPVPSPPFLPPAPTGAVLPPALPSAPDPAHLPRPSTSREESNPVCRPSRTQSDPPHPTPTPTHPRTPWPARQPMPCTPHPTHGAGMPYADWKKLHQKKATPEQMALVRYLRCAPRLRSHANGSTLLHSEPGWRRPPGTAPTSVAIPMTGSNRRRDCHSAAPCSPFSRWFNVDEKGLSVK